MKKQKSDEGSFEANMKRLENIVETLESSNIPLDESIALYEEGIKVSKYCIDKLRSSEIKLKQLKKDIDGKLELFDVDTEE
ncbi:MAG: exodeoxyribonuclease VII small subunit [Ignavibacteriales bacterium]|nr:exodeoxyribonuclease VII small subunit [Ignavibacteriales bacterium]